MKNPLWARSLALSLLLCSALHAAPPAAAELIHDRRQSLLEQLTRRQGQASAVGLLYALNDLRSHLAQPGDIDEAIEALIAAPTAHPLLRDHARYVTARRARHDPQRSDAAALLDPLGMLSEALFLGPFDNTGGANFATGLLDEDKIKLDQAVSGRHRELRWRVVRGHPEQAFVDLGAALDSDRSTLAYALFFIDSPRKTRVALRIGNSDQLCVRVGAAPPRCLDERKPWRFEQHALAYEIGPGRTPVLLRLGNLDGAFRVSLRLTRPEGGPLSSGVELSLPKLDASVDMKAHPARPVAVVDLIAQAQKASQGGGRAARRTALWTLSELLDATRAFDGRAEPDLRRQVARRLAALDAKNPWALWQLARAQASQDQNRQRDTLHDILRHWPQFYLAEQALARHRAAHGLDRRALQHAARALHLAPQDPAVQLTWIDLCPLAQDPLCSTRLLNKLQKQGWLSPATRARLMSDRDRRGQKKEAQALATHILRQDDRYSADALRVAIAAAEREGDIDAALALRRQSTRAQPQMLEPRLRLARWLAWNGRRDQALRQIQSLTPVFAGRARLHREAGEIFLLAGQRKRTQKAWHRALSLRPQQPELRRRLAQIETAGAAASRALLDMAALTQLPTPESQRDAGVYVLGHSIRITLFDNGLYSSVEEIALRLLDDSHARALRRRQIVYSPGREEVRVEIAERLTPDGQSLPAARITDSGPSPRSRGVYSDQRATLVDFEGLRAGDVIHLRSRTDAIGETNLFGDFFGRIAVAQSIWPVHHYELVIDAPADLELFHRQRGMGYEVRAQKDRRLHRFWVDGLPRVQVEPRMPPLIEKVPYLSVSTYESWSDLSRWYVKLVGEQYALDQETRALAHRLVRGVAPKDVREKVRRIHRHVMSATRYVGIELGIHGWKPYRASLVHRRGYGDCKDKATLLVALLREVGVEAELVLLRTVNMGQLDPHPATMWAFNHAIAYVPALDLFIDGTAELSGLDELPTADQGALALRIDRRGRAKIVHPPLQPARANLNTSSYVIALDGDGTAHIEGEEHFRGARAARLRRRYADPATRRRDLERELSDGLPSARIEEVTFGPLDDLDAEIWYRFEATLPKRARVVGDTLQLPISLYPHQLTRSYAALPSRQHDLVIDHPWQTRNVMRYVLPKGMRPDALPSSTIIEGPALRFEQKISATADGFVVDETTTLKRRRVSPDMYRDFRRRCLDADAAMTRPVRIVPRPLKTRANEVSP